MTAATAKGFSSLKSAELRSVVLKDFQIAARAQKASVQQDEVLRYEAYNNKYGARYISAEESKAIEEEEDW